MNSSFGFGRQSNIADLTEKKKPNEERIYQSGLLVPNMVYEIIFRKKTKKQKQKWLTGQYHIIFSTKAAEGAQHIYLKQM